MVIRLLIAEDHSLVREGLRVTFEETDIDIIGEAATADEAVRLASLVEADVMLLDRKLPDGDGLDMLHDIKSVQPKLAVLMYSQHERTDFQDLARKRGACGYLIKRASAAELIDAVGKAGRGESLWPPSEVEREAHAGRGTSTEFSLSERHISLFPSLPPPS